jgi:hypothetical protein
MPTRRSIASIVMFAGSLLCFFLPFATVSCGDVKVISLTGQQMATGTTIETPQAFGPGEKKKTDPNPFAAIALLCAATGVGLSLLGRKLAIAPALAGGAGAVSLFMVKATMDSELQRQGMGAGAGMIQIAFENGYWFALALLAAAAGWNVYLLITNKAQLQSVLPPPPYAQPPYRQ